VLNNPEMGKLESERLKHFPNVNSLLKISLGLIFFTIISTALVYADNISVDVEGTSFDVDYTATGMTVSGIEVDLDSISLIFSVDVTDSTGTLDITFDRFFFDSVFEGADDDFFILVDGDFANFTETETNSQSRTLSVEIPSGTQDVEIIGTFFGDSTSIPADEPTETEPAETEPVETEPAETEPAETEPAETEPAETVDDTQTTQCGPGTVLTNGVCVLDEKCGPGTVLKDGACVLESTPQSSGTSTQGLGKDMIVGVIAAIAVAGAIGIILGLISRVSKSKD